MPARSDTSQNHIRKKGQGSHTQGQNAQPQRNGAPPELFARTLNNLYEPIWHEPIYIYWQCIDPIVQLHLNLIFPTHFVL